MKCKVCGAESGKYPLCRECNIKKERGEIIKCPKCGQWHLANASCPAVNDIIEKTEDFLYEKRERLITKNESLFFEAIKKAVPNGYCVFPQVNLASFIDRTDTARYRNELFRNVDFLITDGEYHPCVVIEINDQSHTQKDRRERDEKVKCICEEAGIPLIKLWTQYGVNEQYIEKKINESLNSPCARVKHFISEETNPKSVSEKTEKQNKKGCYIATCVYGSYDASEVRILRRYRDNYLQGRVWGRLFIKAYYAVSPTVVKLFGNNSIFVSFCKKLLNKKVKTLRALGYNDAPYND